jgi:hypothetical protein
MSKYLIRKIFIQINTKGIHMFYSHKWVCSVVVVAGNVSDGEITTTKVVDFQKVCTSVVDNFYLKSSIQKNYVWISYIWNSNFQMTSDGETTKTKVVHLKKQYNFVVDNCFHLKSSIQGKLYLNFLAF